MSVAVATAVIENQSLRRGPQLQSLCHLLMQGTVCWHVMNSREEAQQLSEAQRLLPARHLACHHTRAASLVMQRANTFR